MRPAYGPADGQPVPVGAPFYSQKKMEENDKEIDALLREAVTRT